MRIAFMARSSHMSTTATPVTAAQLRRLAAEVGIDVVGAAPAAPYAETERHIRDRRARGLFGTLRFTMARPEVSCHPETLLAGARSVVAAARCYWEPGPEPGAGEGRMPRYAWRDHYQELRASLARLGDRLGGAYRVLVDDNAHVDREAAVRAGVGFYGKNTMVITTSHGSWVVLGTLVTDVPIEPSAPLRPGCGSCTLCIDACPTGAIVEPGVLDATRCLSTATQTAGALDDELMDALEDRVYGCDICQDVCPWNRGVERRRAAAAAPDGPAATVPLRAWLADDGPVLERDVERLFVPRNDPRWLRRNALVALGNVGRVEDASLALPYARGDDELLRAVAERALARIGERG
jgi:epoxyqueuosine reductase